MATGIVKSFNQFKGYGFIRLESGGNDVFVHLSAVQNAGLVALRKGQRLSFDIFDNKGRAAAKNLRLECSIDSGTTSGQVPLECSIAENGLKKMSPKASPDTKPRSPITRAALELAIAEAVRESDPELEPLVAVIVERIVPDRPGGANWAIKGIKYGKTERDRCSAAVSKRVEEVQCEFELSD
jgi:CspA family cold shock protein